MWYAISGKGYSELKTMKKATENYYTILPKLSCQLINNKEKEDGKRHDRRHPEMTAF